MNIIAKTGLMLKMAFRNISRQKRRTVVVALTAMVGIFAVTSSQGFMNGFYGSLLSVAIKTGLGHVQIRPADYIDSREPGLLLHNTAEIEKSFLGILPPDVHYAGRIEREAILKIGSDVEGVLLYGIDPEKEKKVSNTMDWISEGEFPAYIPGHTNPRCLLGKRNSVKMEVETGNFIVVTTGKTDGSNVSFRCTVTGIFQAPSSMMEEKMVIMDRKAVANLAGTGNDLSYFVFLGSSLDKSSLLKKMIGMQLAGNADVSVFTYNDLEPSISGIIEMTDQYTWVFYSIILAGFAVILFESVTMSIFERMREIGIIHAIGTSPVFIFGMVIAESFYITMLGVIVGIVTGSGFVYILYYTGMDFSNFDFKTQTMGVGAGVIHPFLTSGDIVESLLIAVVICLLSGIYPAWKSVKISPVKAIYNR